MDNKNLVKAAKRIIDNQKRNGLDVEILYSEKQTKKVQPFLSFKSIKALAYYASEGTIDPFKTISYFAREVKKAELSLKKMLKFLVLKEKVHELNQF
ncbi:MAG: hypothetical protein IMZ60_04985 [Actinobacteria bacterium]|nr:hypothetical protein [Actinomycetota bacterium]